MSEVTSRPPRRTQNRPDVSNRPDPVARKPMSERQERPIEPDDEPTEIDVRPLELLRKR